MQNKETAVTASDKEELQTHIQLINRILDKYPWFEDNHDFHFISCVARCKSKAHELADAIKCLTVSSENC